MLTAQQIEGFKRDGVILLRGFFSLTEVERWRVQIADYFGRPADSDGWRSALSTRKPDHFMLAPDPTPAEYPSLSRIYCALHATAQWTGHNQLVVRAGDDPADWRGPRLAHIDIPVYAPLCTLANNVFYLSEVKPKGGGFIYWPRSHHIAWDYFREFPQDYLASGERTHNQVFERLADRMTEAPVEFVGAPGDLLIWHSLTLHSGSVNKRRDPRLAVFGRWGVVVDTEERHAFSGGIWSGWLFDRHAAPAADRALNPLNLGGP